VPRYLITNEIPRDIPDDDAAEGTTQARGNTEGDGSQGSRRGGPSRNKMTREEKKAQRGANKGRRFGKVRDELDLCWRVANGAVCERGAESVISLFTVSVGLTHPPRCRFSHDIPAYLAAKPRDIHMPQVSQILEYSPFVQESVETAIIHDQYPSLDSTAVCPVFAELGECRSAFNSHGTVMPLVNTVLLDMDSNVGFWGLTCAWMRLVHLF
jgi:tRNA-dihydrouridine synthase 3